MSHHHDHTKSNLKVQAIAVGVGLVILIIKFVAWVVTGSNAILSDALESVINVLAGSLALYSIYYASRPKDAGHLYGHGKMEFISSGIEGILIFSAGLVIMGKGIYNLIDPHDIEELGIGILLTTGAGLVNFILALLLIRRGKETHSSAMESDGEHLLSDAYSTVGMLVGLVVVWLTGMVWLDNIIALFFGALLVRIGFKVLRRALAGIMDETDEKLVKLFIGVLEKRRKEDWIDIHNFRIIKFGSVLHVDCHLTLPWFYDIERGHEIIDEIEEIVNRDMQRRVELFIHIDPCRPHSCFICPKKDCEVRQNKFKERLPWTVDKVLGLDRHGKKEYS